MNLKPGDIFEERFEIISLLGTGGMASVFHGRQLDAARHVAIKIPHLNERDNAEDVIRFFRESKILAKLSSPHIMTIYSIGKSKEGFPYAVCEYMEGRTLRELINEGPIPWQRVSKIALQVSIGLKDAHAQGVVHRDLKPENIFLLEKPEPDYVKVLDFGLSKMLLDLKQSQKLTKTGFLLGTAGYISPELIAGKSVDHRSDIYSLGCIIFEMLMGEKLFDADNSIGLIYKHSNESPEPQLAKLASKVPGGIIEVLRKALAKNPENRFSNMAEFLAAIEAAMENKKTTKPTKLGIPALITVLILFSLIPITYWGFRSLDRSGLERNKRDQVDDGSLDVANFSRIQLKLFVNRAETDFAALRYSEALEKLKLVTDVLLKSERRKSYKSERLKSYDCPKAFLLQLKCLYELGRIEEAKRFLELADSFVSQQPEADEFLYYKAKIAQRMHNYDLALKTIDSCNFLTKFSTHVFKASVYEDKQDWQSAIKQRLLGLDNIPKRSVDEPYLASYYASCYAEIAGDYVQIKDYKSAIAYCREAVELYPKDLSAYLKLRRVYEAQGATDKALQACNEAIEVSPKSSDAYCNRAVFFYNKCDYQKSLSDVDRAISLSPQFAYAYGLKGLALSRMGRLQEAIAFATTAISLKPREWFFHKDRGYFYGCIGEWKKDLADSEAELKLRPSCTFSLNNKGYSLCKLQHYSEARKALEEAILCSPDYTVSILNLAWLSALTGDASRSDTLAERARKLNGKSDFYYYCVRALSSLQKSDLKSATIFVAKAKEKIPRSPCEVIAKGEFYCLQGMLNRESGKFSDAMDDFSNAIKYDSTDAFVFQQRAKLFSVMKDEARAREDNAHAAQLLI